MKAMVLEQPGQPLVMLEVERPEPGPDEVLIRVHCCGVCRTDLHIVDGELNEPRLPLIPGHEIVGVVEKIGSAVDLIFSGQRVGVPWLAHTCGHCGYCRSGRENLCDSATFTGYQSNGGYAEYTLADQRFCYPIPDQYSAIEAAPLLCAGLIGYRSLRLAGEGKCLGLYGFGAAAHILIQIARYQGREIFAFTRPGDAEGQQFARSLGASWVGAAGDQSPELLDAAIIFAPVGELVIDALRAVKKGGLVVCAGIHMSDIPSFAYQLLWGERVIRSVANLTRQDGLDFFTIAPKVPVTTEVQTYALSDANKALADLKNGKVRGAAVLVMEQ